MANTLTNVNLTRIYETCIGALKDSLVPLRVFSLGVGDTPAEKNEYVNVPLVTARTASTNATNYEDGNTTIVGKQVQLAQNHSCSFHITAIQASKTPTDVFESAAREAVYAVGNMCQVSALNLLTAASFTNETIKTAANFDADYLADLRASCVGSLKWRMGDKAALLCEPTYYANLLKDPAIRDASASTIASGIMGEVKRFAGFDIYECPAIADASTVYAGTEDLRCVAILPRALALAIRPPAQVGTASFETNDIISDPEGTGFAMNMRTWVNTATNTLWGTVEVLFGGVAVDGSGAWRVIAE